MHPKTWNQQSDNSNNINVHRDMKFRLDHMKHIYMEYKKFKMFHFWILSMLEYINVMD